MTPRDEAFKVQEYVALMHKDLAARITADPTLLSSSERRGFFLAVLMASVCEIAAYEPHLSLHLIEGITASMTGELSPEGGEAVSEFNTLVSSL